MSAMYAVYHGPDGLRHIGTRIHNGARILAKGEDLKCCRILCVNESRITIVL